MILSGIQWLKKPLKSKSLDSRFRGNDGKKPNDTVSKGRGIIINKHAQAFTEYILVFALVALLFGAVLGLWRGPLAHYLNRIARAVAAAR
jgi:hypothetical protein